MTEAQLQAAVLGLCKLLGLLAYHTHDSRRSQPGYPDLTIAGSRVIFRELKSSTGRLRPEQAQWAQKLTAADADFAIWRPADLRSGRIQRELQAIR